MDEKKTRGDLPLTAAEELAERQANEPARLEPLCDEAEFILDADFISIPRRRYDELLKAETRLDVISKFYLVEGNGYQLGDLLKVLFGPRKESADA